MAIDVGPCHATMNQAKARGGVVRQPVQLETDEATAPWTIIAYARVQIVWMMVYRITEGTGSALQIVLFGILIEVALGYGMFRRSKVAWIIALILMALPILDVGSSFLRSGPGAGLREAIGIIATLFILLHPRTRAWCPPTSHERGTA